MEKFNGFKRRILPSTMCWENVKIRRVQMKAFNMRIEEELKKRFEKACEITSQSMTGVIKVYMKHFIEEVEKGIKK
jgi:hypothetical protein